MALALSSSFRASQPKRIELKLRTLSAVISLSLALAGCTTSQPVLTGKSATWSEGACTQVNPGVTLSIDFKGKVTTHCASSYRGDGWKLFGAAGFDVRGTAKYPTSFACQINGEPANAKCDDSDTSGAYWGYFVAVDGVWGYATTGASDHQAACGESEGWVYMETEKTVSHLPAPTTYSCK